MAKSDPLTVVNNGRTDGKKQLESWEHGNKNTKLVSRVRLTDINVCRMAEVGRHTDLNVCHTTQWMVQE